ncbi:hypothetical protein [Chromobacterium sp.]|uniref:hypothetical protein n=1 Tax=Chromobacterium sp. TaxID=306190 RepID=UPI0035B00FF0
MTTHGRIPLYAALLLLVAASSLFAILSGADYLSAMLPGGLPLGNVLAALVFLGMSGAGYLLAKERRVLGRIAAIVLAGSVLWLPVSVALARNASLNFAGWNGTLWFLFTVGLFFAALGVLLFAAGTAVRSARKAKNAAE